MGGTQSPNLASDVFIINLVMLVLVMVMPKWR